VDISTSTLADDARRKEVNTGDLRSRIALFSIQGLKSGHQAAARSLSSGWHFFDRYNHDPGCV